MKRTLKIAAGLVGVVAAVAGVAALAQQDGRSAHSMTCMHDGGHAGAGPMGQGMKHGGGMGQMQERMGRNHARMAEMHARMHGDAGASDQREDGHQH